jgi:hypothetical protein
VILTQRDGEINPWPVWSVLRGMHQSWLAFVLENGDFS